MIPVSAFDTVPQQPNKILVSDTSNYFNLNLELFFSLSPEKCTYHGISSARLST